MTNSISFGRLFEGTGFLPPMTTYAQNFEDVTLRRALRDIENGFWVDIGANHPTNDSVTRWFYEQGWSGVNVEPNPAFLKLLHDDRKRDTNVGVAVGAVNGNITLHVIGDTGLSTTVRDLAESHRCAGLPTTAEINVEVVSLDNLLDNYAAGKTIDFLKIDAEGAETDIVAGAAFTRHRPRIILLENLEGYEEPLLRSGYIFAWFDGLNRFYVREEDSWRADVIARPPCVWDQATPAALTTSQPNAESQHAELSSYIEKIETCYVALTSTREELEACRRELNAIRMSTSWRWTRPLRTLGAILGRRCD